MGCEIIVQDVNVFFSGKTILNHLTFQVNPGEFIGIIGPNGAGKTTLFRTLLGMIQPQSGTILFRDANRQPVSPAAMIGYVPQSRQMDAETPLTAREFVSLGLRHKIRPWLTAADQFAVGEALRLTQSEHLADQMIGKLSGGERQRIYLAQALIRNPQVLLLDEPTSNLDPGAQEKMAEVVAKISAESGVSVLFISHDINLMARYATRILYLTNENYAVGTVDEVIQSDVLSKLYGSAIEVAKKGTKLLIIFADDEVVAPICYHGET